METKKIIKNTHEVYVDLRGSRPELFNTLKELYVNLINNSAENLQDGGIQNSQKLIYLSPQDVFDLKMKDLQNPESSDYTIAEFAQGYESKNSYFIVQELLKHMKHLNIDSLFTNEGGYIIFPRIGMVEFGSDGIITQVKNNLIGKDIFHVLSCFIDQDLAVITKNNDNKFIYSADISRFDKTPKDENGKNTFLGKDIVNFHAQIHETGQYLGKIFQALIDNFDQLIIKQLTVDLHGAKKFKNKNQEEICRFEREYFIPYYQENGEMKGIIGIGNVYFQKSIEVNSPYEGGRFYTGIKNQQLFATLIQGDSNEKYLDQDLANLLMPSGVSHKEKLQIIRNILNNRSKILQQYRNKILRLAHAHNVKNFGDFLELYGISYISDKCVNDCSYCGHNINVDEKRNTLNEEQMRKDFTEVIKNHPEELCILAGESIQLDAYKSAVKIANEINKQFGTSLKRITLNIAPLSQSQFTELVEVSDLPLQYRIFQELYDQKQYKKYHTKGPKSNYKKRYNAQSVALEAGFSEVGIGALLGLNTNVDGNDDEIIALIQHAYELQEQYGYYPNSISIPRHQEAEGVDFDTPNPVSDNDYILYHALLRLALPKTKIIVTSRESAHMMQKLEKFTNIRDLAPRPGVGGNILGVNTRFQNIVNDDREALEIINKLIKSGKRRK